MATFRVTRNALLLAHDQNLINDEEFILLYDINTSSNLEFPYWKYPSFNLENISDAECAAEFRILKSDVYKLAEVMQIPPLIKCYNRSVFDGLECFCVFLKRFAYPCRYGDMVPRYGRPAPELCLMSNATLDHIYNRFGRLLHDFNQLWLAPQQLEIFANKIHSKEAPLDNCWGFVDGTVRPVCRPGHNQRIIYNGHKRIHALKFQSIVAPNGLIANLFGPVEGCRHDSAMLAMSQIYPQMQQFSRDQNGRPMCIYGDPAYPHRPQLQGPFKGNNLTPLQKQYNKAMSEVRASVEWVFGDLVNYFAFMDFKKKLKVGLSAVGKMYIVCALLTNAHTCLYKSMTSTFFDLDPPIIENYFQ